MSTFPLRIGTPDGLLYEGEVARLVCRTSMVILRFCQDTAITVRHLAWEKAHIILEDGSRKNAACIGGMLSVMNGTCRLLATTWEWKEDIDAERAQNAKKRAEEMIAKGGLTDQEYKMVSAKLQRALVRLSVKE